MTSKAKWTLGFLRRNIYKCPQDIKEQAYKSLVRPHLEYASAVWDPYRQKHINNLEMVQWWSGRFVTSTYSREPGTVTKIMQDLRWQTLETRRKAARLKLFHKPSMEKLLWPSQNMSENHQEIQDSITRTAFPDWVLQQMLIKTASYPKL